MSEDRTCCTSLNSSRIVSSGMSSFVIRSAKGLLACLPPDPSLHAYDQETLISCSDLHAFTTMCGLAGLIVWALAARTMQKRRMDTGCHACVVCMWLVHLWGAVLRLISELIVLLLLDAAMARPCGLLNAN